MRRGRMRWTLVELTLMIVGFATNCERSFQRCILEPRPQMASPLPILRHASALLHKC